MLVHTKDKNIGLSELRGELAQRLKLPTVEIENIILLDRRSLTDAEKSSGATVTPVPTDSRDAKKSGDNPVRSGEGSPTTPTRGDV